VSGTLPAAGAVTARTVPAVDGAPGRRGARRWAGDVAGRVLPDLAAGALAGLLVGGVGGRAAMFVLRLTSPDGVRGLESDDGFTIGRFSTATAFLLLATAALGALAGLFHVVVRPLLPGRSGSAAFGVLGGLVGGAAILHDDGIDFSLVQPPELSVVLFVAIPWLGAWAVAALGDRWRARWPTWSGRRRVAALVPAVPWAALAVVAVPTLAAVVLVDQLARVPRLRGGTLGRLVVAAGRVALVASAGLAGWVLVGDVRAIL
jgi:hypothetical protein